jgi:hypothetical protein
LQLQEQLTSVGKPGECLIFAPRDKVGIHRTGFSWKWLRPSRMNYGYLKTRGGKMFPDARETDE